MEKVIGNCGKHPGQSMVDCPLCATEKQRHVDKGVEEAAKEYADKDQWESGKSFCIQAFIAGAKWASSGEAVELLVEALKQWQEAHRDFESGYKNIDGKATRMDISTLSYACNEADSNLRKAYQLFKQKP